MGELENKAKYISNYLKMENGIFVNSGTIALLAALKLENIKPGDRVLINGYCCCSLYEAIMNVGAHPIFIIPKNFFNISMEELDEAINTYNIDCFIAAHQYGIVQDIEMIKKRYPNLKIIEDISQAWNIKENDLGIGAYSDYVITSFGKTKPLSYGQAGAILSNKSLIEYFDLHDTNSRSGPRFLLPYALYDLDNFDERALIERANKIVTHQRQIVDYFQEYFSKGDAVTVYHDSNNQQSVWQRYPVIIEDESYLPFLEQELQKYQVLYQLPFEQEVWELDMVKNYNCTVIESGIKPKYILLRTRQNDLNNVKRLVRSKR